MAETVAAIHRVLASGSSFPSVVETSAGHLYVLKLSGAGPGRRALATEYLALKIARNLGLTVPDALVIDLPRDFPGKPARMSSTRLCNAARGRTSVSRSLRMPMT